MTNHMIDGSLNKGVTRRLHRRSTAWSFTCPSLHTSPGVAVSCCLIDACLQHPHAFTRHGQQPESHLQGPESEPGANPDRSSQPRHVLPRPLCAVFSKERCSKPQHSDNHCQCPTTDNCAHLHEFTTWTSLPVTICLSPSLKSTTVTDLQGAKLWRYPGALS